MKQNDQLFPVQIIFQQMHASEALKTYIHSRLEKLTQCFGHIMGCHVLLEIINGHHHQGKLFHVCVELAVPNKKLVVSRNNFENHAHEDAFVAIRDAFQALRRKLQNHMRKQKGKRKCHEIPAHGRVLRLLPEGDHGFIESSDGRNVYFTRNSVVGKHLNKIAEGDWVRFVETAADTGKTRASTVRLMGKHHFAA